MCVSYDSIITVRLVHVNLIFLPLRLEGANFPPVIVFKVFMECNSIKYMSGKSVIQPSIEVHIQEDPYQLFFIIDGHYNLFPSPSGF